MFYVIEGWRADGTCKTTIQWKTSLMERVEVEELSAELVRKYFIRRWNV